MWQEWWGVGGCLGWGPCRHVGSGQVRRRGGEAARQWWWWWWCKGRPKRCDWCDGGRSRRLAGRLSRTGPDRLGLVNGKRDNSSSQLAALNTGERATTQQQHSHSVGIGKGSTAWAVTKWVAAHRRIPPRSFPATNLDSARLPKHVQSASRLPPTPIFTCLSSCVPNMAL